VFGFSSSVSGAKSPAPVAKVVTQPLSFTDVAAGAMPAVVNISTTETVEQAPIPGPFGEEDPLEQFFRRFFGERLPPGERQSLGSGFIISADGFIVTNNHVIGNAKRITVRLAQPRDEEYAATVVGGVDELTDLALIKIAARRPLPTIPLGSSANLQIGEWLIAIGNPFGPDQTMTAGIVSGKGRVIGAGPYDDFIQTDASINPGNSGGPLLNLRGKVVGVNSAILCRAGGNIGIGFAIPIDLVKSVVAQLKATGKVTRGWLGVTFQPATPDIAGLFGLDEPRGALIADVTKCGPAGAAGIRCGDIIISLNGIPIKESHELPAIVARTPVGERAKVGVLRDGREQTFTVTIGELPSRPPKAEQNGRREDAWGMAVTGISPDIGRRFRFEAEQEGLVVIAIAPASSAARAGIQVGDVIEEVNRQPIRTLEDFAKATTAAKDSDRPLLLTRRGNFSSYRVLRKRD
jgi:serine protease Do